MLLSAFRKIPYQTLSCAFCHCRLFGRELRGSMYSAMFNQISNKASTRASAAAAHTDETKTRCMLQATQRQNRLCVAHLNNTPQHFDLT
jgi:hypothetical protein